MKYLKKTLSVGEQMIICKHPHWVLFVHPITLISLAVFCVSVVLLIAGDFELFILIVLFISIVPLIYAYIKHICTEYAVTSKRVICKTGFISITINELRKEKIENIIVNYSIIGRILGYGDLSFTGTGGSPVVFDKIGRPKSVKKQIEKTFYF